MNRLLGFGYWHSLDEPTLPDPAWFIDASWSADERGRVKQYLAQGHRINYWMGFSWCRFRCGISTSAMGACDLTDGTYCWPEGLAHYVSTHNLRPPEQIVRHILNQSAFPTQQAQQVPEFSEMDLTWWYSQKAWHPAATSFLSENNQQTESFVKRYDQGKLFFEDYTETGLRAVIALINRLKSQNT